MKVVIAKSPKKNGVILLLIPLNLIMDIFANVEIIVLNLYLTWILLIVIHTHMNVINAVIV